MHSFILDVSLENRGLRKEFQGTIYLQLNSTVIVKLIQNNFKPIVNPLTPKIS